MRKAVRADDAATKGVAADVLRPGAIASITGKPLKAKAYAALRRSLLAGHFSSGAQLTVRLLAEPL